MKFLLCSLILSSASSAGAAVIVDNLSQKDFFSSVYIKAAQRFYTTYDSWILTDLMLIGYGTSPSIKVSIFSSYHSDPESRIATLYSGSAHDAGFRTNSTSTTPTTFTFSPVTLDPGTEYWVVVENLSYFSGFEDLAWGASYSGNNGFYGDGYSAVAKRSVFGPSWGNYHSPYIMTITAIPEPNCLMILGLGGLVIIRRSRLKCQSEQSGAQQPSLAAL